MSMAEAMFGGGGGPGEALNENNFDVVQSPMRRTNQTLYVGGTKEKMTQKAMVPQE